MLDCGNRIGLNADNPFAVRLPSFIEWSTGLNGDDEDEGDVMLPPEAFSDRRPGYVIVEPDGSTQVLHDDA